MAYLQIDDSGKTTGYLANAGPDMTGFVQVDDDDPRISAFLSPAITPAESADALLAQKIAAGIAITSTGAPSLNSTYALDPLTLSQIQSVAQDAASGLGLPGGGATFTYPDATGAPRSFTAEQLIAVYRAMRDLLLVLNTQAAILGHGGSASWPDQSASIA